MTHLKAPLNYWKEKGVYCIYITSPNMNDL